MPKFLNSAKGVDSEDLPLNVLKRTMSTVVWQNKLLKVTKKNLVHKTAHYLEDGKYNDTFWNEFSTNIKLDRTEDNSNRIQLAKLVRSQSSHHPTGIKSLDQHVEKTKEKKRTIYA